MMKKTLVAIAAATVALGAQAAELVTDKDTKFEINVDVGVYHIGKRDSNGRELTQFTGDGLNQVEIKATRTIDSDISIFGEIEVDYNPLVDNSPFLSDDFRIGIASKTFGRIAAGQFDSYIEDNVMEVLQLNHGEEARVSEPSSGNDARHVQYSHKLGDLTVAVDYTSAYSGSTLKENANGFAVTAAYKLGDLTAALGWSEIAKYKNGADNGTNSDQYAIGLALTYKMGNVGLRALAAETENRSTKVKTTYAGAALTYVMGQFDTGVAMQTVQVGTANATQEWSLVFGYTPFKNMQVYLDLAGFGQDKGKDDLAELGFKYTF